MKGEIKALLRSLEAQVDEYGRPLPFSLDSLLTLT
jgi:hypothetical protein